MFWCCCDVLNNVGCMTWCDNMLWTWVFLTTACHRTEFKRSLPLSHLPRPPMTRWNIPLFPALLASTREVSNCRHVCLENPSGLSVLALSMKCTRRYKGRRNKWEQINILWEYFQFAPWFIPVCVGTQIVFVLRHLCWVERSPGRKVIRHTLNM